MKFWTVPRCFEGGTVAILASGERSMSQLVADLVRDAGIPAIAINSTFRLSPWAWMLYAADAEWWMHKHNRDASRFAGLKVTCSTGTESCPGLGLTYLKQSGAAGFDPSPECVRTGGNGGYQALHIAAHTGAKKVLLLGFDMEGCHWHGPHPQGLKATHKDQYERWKFRFGELAPSLKGRGIDVVNVTPGSKLQCFRMARLEDELAACAQLVPG